MVFSKELGRASPHRTRKEGGRADVRKSVCNRGTAGVGALRQELQGGPGWAGPPEFRGRAGGGRRPCRSGQAH